MAVYRFRVCLEDNEDIVRDIDIKSSQNFELFHNAIQEAFKFDNKHEASFFVSDDYWRKNREITLRKEDLPLEPEEIKLGVEPKKLMSETKIASFIEQPHQRFFYVFDAKVQWNFLVEMVKMVEENPKVNYPACIKSIGNPPKQYKQTNMAKEELSPDLAMAGLLNDPEMNDDEIYKKLDTGEEGVEQDDLDNLEGEEGEDEFGEEEGEEGEDFNDNEGHDDFSNDESHD